MGFLLEQRKENVVLGHRKRALMRLLISPLQGIVNALLNGQLVLRGARNAVSCLHLAPFFVLHQGGIKFRPQYVVAPRPLGHVRQCTLPSANPRFPCLARIFAVLSVVTGIRKLCSVWRAKVNVRSLHRTRNALSCLRLAPF